MSDRELTSLRKQVHWCSSHIKTREFEFTWVIDKFLVRTEEPGRAIRSSKFIVGTNNCRSEWIAKVYPRSMNVEHRNYVSVYLSFNCPAGGLTIDFRCTILNRNMKEENAKTYVGKMQSGVQFGWLKFIKSDILKLQHDRLLPNENLTIFIQGCVVTDDKNQNESGERKLLNFQMPEFDVTLCVNGELFNVHKAVLAAQSEVFAGIFDRMYKDTREIEIKGISPFVMNKMLHYIYTSRVDDLGETAIHLLPAADNYRLPKLKALCTQELFRTICVKNAFDILNVAELYGERLLKDMAISFINSHFNQVIESRNYNDIVKRYPHLVNFGFYPTLIENKSTCCGGHPVYTGGMNYGLVQQRALEHFPNRL